MSPTDECMRATWTGAAETRGDEVRWRSREGDTP
jgi:hypothetical protein